MSGWPVYATKDCLPEKPGLASYEKAGRKKYRCDNCRQPIEMGQPSTVISGVHDGDFSSFRVHPECDDLWNEIYREIDAWDGMDIDTLEALGLGRDEYLPALQQYAVRHPVAAERLMVTVRKWIAADETDAAHD